MYAEGTKGLLTIEKSVNLEAYSAKGAPELKPYQLQMVNLQKP